MFNEQTCSRFTRLLLLFVVTMPKIAFMPIYKDFEHCTMAKLWHLGVKAIIKLSTLENDFSANFQRGEKTWRGCFSQTKLVPKKLFWWMLWYLFFEHLWKTPSCRRKLHSKSEKNVLQISHLIFGSCRVAKYTVYKFTFTFHVFCYVSCGIK